VDKIVVHNKSILQWQEITNDPCFVVGTEVLVIFLSHFLFSIPWASHR